MLPLLQVFRILLNDCPPGLEPVDHRLEPLVRSDVLVLSEERMTLHQHRITAPILLALTHPEGLRKVDHHPDGRGFATHFPSLLSRLTLGRCAVISCV